MRMRCALGVSLCASAPERVTISEKLMMWGKGGPEAVGYLRHWKHRPLSHDRPPHANGPDGPDEGRLPLLMERFQVRVLVSALYGRGSSTGRALKPGLHSHDRQEHQRHSGKGWRADENRLSP